MSPALTLIPGVLAPRVHRDTPCPAEMPGCPLLPSGLCLPPHLVKIQLVLVQAKLLEILISSARLLT